MIRDNEHVARVIFEPKMVYHGVLLAPAFELRASINESYLSVLRIDVESWRSDMASIPTRRNRRLYGYAKMNVGEIRHIKLRRVDYDVGETTDTAMASHAGIFVKVNGEPLIGGKPLETLPEGITEDFILLAIRNRLVELAQKGLCKLEEKLK